MFQKNKIINGLIICGLISTGSIIANEIGFIEDYSLSSNKEVPLKQLIPGTENYYYYHCLHLQNKGNFDEVEKHLTKWIKRYGYTLKVNEILNRQALLIYKQNPEKSLERIKKVLGLRFNHQRVIADAKTEYPSVLNQNLISFETLKRRALSSSKNLSGISDRGLDFLDHSKLNSTQLRHYLNRISNPDLPNLAELIIKDLNAKYSRGFGSLKIHNKLFLSQLDECLKLMPKLKNETKFVNQYLSKLIPSETIDWENIPEEKNIYLNRLLKYVRTLSPVHNSLKANVIYNKLEFDLTQGVYDNELFMEYIKLPKYASYANYKYYNNRQNRNYKANLNADYANKISLPRIKNDKKVVVAYLQHFFIEDENYNKYRDYIQDYFLKEVFAKTKILNGIGNQEKWYSYLTPEQYRLLKEKIEIDFLPTNKKLFTVDDEINLSLNIKNIQKLLVKIYQVNLENYYKINKKEPALDINLTGLKPNIERVVEYNEIDLKRHREIFYFEELNNKRGSFVIEFIGNGKSSRAIVNIGKLKYISKVTAAGHAFKIFNNKNNQIKDASILLNSHKYTANKNGTIYIPFTTYQKDETIIIYDGDFCSLDKFTHLKEKYSLAESAIFVDRESLIKQKKAKVLIRPNLLIHNSKVPLSLLKEVKLIIKTTDRFGIDSIKTIDDFKLYSDKESVYEFMVPKDLMRVSFNLSAKIKNKSLNEDVNLNFNKSFVAINELDKEKNITQPLLKKDGKDYILSVLGKNGEPKVDYSIKITVEHKFIVSNKTNNLKTNKNGEINLGELKNIIMLTAYSEKFHSFTWNLSNDKIQQRKMINAIENQEITIPYLRDSQNISHKEFSLIELKGGANFKNHLDKIEIENGFIKINNLKQGNYIFKNKASNETINISVNKGEQIGSYLFADIAINELNKPALQITQIRERGNKLIINTKNSSKSTRFHIVATKFNPEFEFFNLIKTNKLGVLSLLLNKNYNGFQSGINTGDEFNYILNRKYAKIYAGNMLERPALLLNPFVLNNTNKENAKDLKGAGVYSGRKGKGRFKSKYAPASARYMRGGEGVYGHQRSITLDFLANPAVTLYNLRPDENGQLIIDLDKLKNKQEITVVAIDDDNTVMRKVYLPEKVAEIADQRLTDNLNSQKHYLEEKKISVLKTKEEILLKDVTPSSFYLFDSLSSVHAIYTTLLGKSNPSEAKKLAEFAFILNWNTMKEKEKLEKYSNYSCHELNYFIYKKDKSFFDKTVLPYIQNKKDKTFLDKWFLKEDLSEYLKPQNYRNRLNIMEKILLASVIENEIPATQRFVKEAYNIIPANPEKYSRIFETALKASALETYSISSKMIVKQEGKKRKNQKRIGATRASSINVGSIRQNNSIFAKEMSVSKFNIKPKSKRVNSAPPMSEKRLGSLDFSEDEDFEAREEQKQLYRKLPKTEELAENNYYKLAIELQNSNLIKVNAFWKDFSKLNSLDILSANFAEANMNFTEIMFALSSSSLPFKSKKHSYDFKNNDLNIKTANSAILFHKEISETKDIEQQKIIVSQNYFDSKNKFSYIDNRQIRKFITNNELLVDKVYGCHFVITNPTSKHYKINILTQIPQGAIAVNNWHRTKTIHRELQPYQTITFEYLFYFPETGEFTHFPVHISNNDNLLGYADSATLKVVKKLSEIDKTSWEYISQNGSNEDVIKYLNQNNLNRINLNKIAFRMRDKEFFETIIKLLDKNHCYNKTLWSYAVYHNNKSIMTKYLETTKFVKNSGDYIKSELLNINPTFNRKYQHLEYSPLINARTYQIGNKREILNNNLFKQYNKLLKILSYKATLNDEDLITVTYYLLLQDRIESAISFFKRINKNNLKTKIQYDYCSAYIAFYEEDISKAAKIAKTYIDYPVLRWKNKFTEILNQIDEINGANSVVIDDKNRQSQMTKLASDEATLELKIIGKKILVNYESITECEINYYLMDIEFLFSQNPFVQGYGKQFSYIMPNKSIKLKLDKNKKSKEFEILKEYQNSNILIEIKQKNKNDFKTYFANSMNVKLEENYGQIKVVSQDDNAPLSKVYVKVYAKLISGKKVFYKDGYTDLRGRFDYVSNSNDIINEIEKFSILIISKKNGAVIKETLPPKQ